MMEKLTEAQQATNFETTKHIRMVQRLLNACAIELIRRGEIHDDSKLESPEVEAFTEFTPKLAGCTFGSDVYKSFLTAMKPALEHHYANNRHHPEHFKDGVNDMNILDLLEMLCDWKAASTRHNDGNLRKSIDINAKRFGIDSQLRRIFENSISLVEED